MKRMLVPAVAALTACGAFAGMYDKPYALVESGDRSQVREEFPPAITQVDGKSTRNTRKPDPIEPGKHRVTVRFETGRVAQGPAETSRELELDLEACTRYRIAAHRVDSVNWEPKVYPEPIAECVKKFRKAG